ncbi:hypothetical protein MFUL124B02_36310 [Myxococcus fulvus 124B02]|nr:hypothetical protein MFUL124B02_36310 [Myxococcus fulvus 124B02]
MQRTVPTRRPTVVVDSNYKTCHRINFRHAFKQQMPTCRDLKGRWMHRRHVIPQHLLREVWDATVTGKHISHKKLEALGNALGMAIEYKSVFELATSILQTLNENQNNLFLGPGIPNSAIGAIGNALMDLVEKYSQPGAAGTSVATVIAEIKQIRAPAHWGGAVQAEVHKLIQEHLPLFASATSLDELQELMEDVADTANLDFDTTEGLGPKNAQAMALYLKFKAWVNAPGTWDDFISLMVAFMHADMVDSSSSSSSSSSSESTL